MEQIQIKPYAYVASEVAELYCSVGWVYYSKHPEVVRKAYEGSLCTFGAYDGGKLVGIIRCVGDGYTILFIQDLLVLPSYQRRGIGTGLMKTVLERYRHVYQIELATDDTEKTVSFYKQLGFRSLQEMGGCGFLMNGILE